MDHQGVLKTLTVLYSLIEEDCDADSMNYQNLMKPKEAVAGGWPDTMRGEGRMLLNLTWKAHAAK
jgi:hypothetical protein